MPDRPTDPPLGAASLYDAVSLSSLVLRRPQGDASGTGFDLELLFTDDGEDPGRAVHLGFRGVRDLRLGHLDPLTCWDLRVFDELRPQDEASAR